MTRDVIAEARALIEPHVLQNLRLSAAIPQMRDTIAALLAHIDALTTERDAALAEAQAMRESGSWFQEKDIDRLMEERDAALAEVAEARRLLRRA